MLGTILFKIMIYGYYTLIPASMIATVIFDRKYEKYKREKGYKNNYKGTYKTKGIFDERIIEKIKTIADLGVTFLVPGYQYEPLIELALFKGEARTTLHKEEDSKAIEWVDPSIIDADFRIVSEEKVANEEEVSEGENVDLVMNVVSRMENPGFYDEDEEEYAEAVDSFMDLYNYYREEIDKQNTADLDEVDEKRAPSLK